MGLTKAQGARLVGTDVTMNTDQGWIAGRVVAQSALGTLHIRTTAGFRIEVECENVVSLIEDPWANCRG